MPDVLIVGAGIIGAACARSLAGHGHSVTVLERGTTASGTSAACEGNLLVSDKTPGPELELARAAVATWPAVAAELRAELGADFPGIEYEPKGGIVVTTTEPGLAGLLDFAANQRAAGIDARPLDPDEARAFEPDLTTTLTGAVHYPEDAQLQPVLATEAMLASARLRGAIVRRGVEVTGGVRRPDGRLCGLLTSAGEIAADIVIIAAGPWSGMVADRVGVVLPVRPRRGMILVTSPMRRRVFHKVYDGDYFAATQSADAALQTSSVVESTQGGTVLIGSSREQVGFDPQVRATVLRELAAKAIGLFPFLSGINAIRGYAGFRPYMPDHLPVIGPDPRMPGLWHATGHEGAGIGLSAVTGELLATQLLGLTPRLDPAPFQLDRPSLATHLEAT